MSLDCNGSGSRRGKSGFTRYSTAIPFGAANTVVAFPPLSSSSSSNPHQQKRERESNIMGGKDEAAGLPEPWLLPKPAIDGVWGGADQGCHPLSPSRSVSRFGGQLHR